MRAVEEYREADSETTYTTPQEAATARKARAAIAELEAEAEATLLVVTDIMRQRNEAQAELAARKSQDCIGCKHVAICGLHVFWMTPGSYFEYTDGHAVTYCSEWTARAEEGTP